MENKSRKILVLSILFTIFALLAVATTFISSNGETTQLVIGAVLFIIMTLGVIGMWTLYIDGKYKSFTFLKIYNILKNIALICAIIFMVLVLFVIQDIAASCNNQPEVSPTERIRVSWPFMILGCVVIVFMVIYNRFINAVRNESVSSQRAIVVCIANIVYMMGLVALFFIIDLDMNNLLSVILFISTIAIDCLIHLFSSYIIYSKYIK